MWLWGWSSILAIKLCLKEYCSFWRIQQQRLSTNTVGKKKNTFIKYEKWENLNHGLLEMLPLFKLLHVLTTTKFHDLAGHDSADSSTVHY